MLALANDSVYGPLNSFAGVLARVEASAADVIGLTDSYDYWHHIQSYVTFYKNAAFGNRSFRRFWSTYWAGDRGDIIWHAELELLRTMKAGGLEVEVLYPSTIGSTVNPTLQGWRALVERGFPFVKVQLLRDNPHQVDISAWARVMTDGGFDPSLVVRDLGDNFPASSAGRTLSV